MPVPLGLTKASAYSSSASQFRFRASDSWAKGEEKFTAAQPCVRVLGGVAPTKATCSRM